MTDKPVLTAISHEGLLGKSRVYVQRAFRAKQAKDLDEYQLWLSLALELLGKAALANIHPSLVVDPTHSKSLFAASGIVVSSDIKTIGAGTLYERLGHLSKYFDKNVKDFCDAISLRRNAELHSGELPFHQMRLEAWEGRFWHAAQIILDLLRSNLEEWLGADRAKAPKQIVAEAAEALQEAAKLRVLQARDHFSARPKKQRDEALLLSKTKHAFHYQKIFKLVAEHEWEVDCPAWGGRPARVKTHGKKREHGQHSYDFGRERGYLVRLRDGLPVCCVQSWRAIWLARSIGYRDGVLHAINWGANAGDDFACNTSS
jgi:hypothetical protein